MILAVSIAEVVRQSLPPRPMSDAGRMRKVVCA